MAARGQHTSNGFSQMARTSRDGLRVLAVQQACRSVTVITQALSFAGPEQLCIAVWMLYSATRQVATPLR